MNRFRRSVAVVTSALVMVAVSAAPAWAATLTATYGSNTARLATNVTLCDREADGRPVLVQVSVKNHHGQGYVATYRNANGAGTCRTFDVGYVEHHRQIRVCEYSARSGITGCGTWKSSITPA